MDAEAFKDNEEATLKKERQCLRAFISLCHGEILSNTPLDLDTVKEEFTRLCEVQRKFVANELSLTNGGDPGKQMEEHAKYVRMMQEITEYCTPKVARTRPTEVKLPKVIANDPASWRSFKEMFEMSIKHQSVSNDEKVMQLIKALPTKVAGKLWGKPFKEAMTIAAKCFESTDALVNVVRAKFRALPRIENIYDVENLRLLQEEIDVAISLSAEEQVINEAFQKALAALPRSMQIGFVDAGVDLSLASLNKFLERRIKGIGLLETICGQKVDSKPQQTELKTKKSSKPNNNNKPSEKFTSKKGKSAGKAKVHAVDLSDDSDSESDNVDLSSTSSNKLLKKYSCRPKINLAKLMDTSESEAEEEILIDTKVDGKEVQMLYDPGSDQSLLPPSLLPDVKMKKRFSSASGHPIKAFGPVKVDIEMNGETVPIKAYVNDCNLAILGRNFTGRTSTQTDGKSTTKVTLHHNGKKTVIFRKTENNKYQKRKRRQRATFSLGDICNIFACATESDLDDDEEDDSPKSKSSESPQLAALLDKWSKLDIGLGDTDQVQHRLYVKPNTRPINARGRRLPVKHLPKVKKAIEEMLKLNVIEECQSEWCSGIVPVSKKDGSIRVAVDYRPINEVCQKDAYPMPRIDEIIERLTNAKVFSKLDLTKGYYQVRIHPDDRKYTAFRFGKKLYQFTRMPFGLCSAPQTFQRLMNQVLSHLPFAECYLDDIVVFSANEEEHLHHLEEVFKALEKANLRFNREKCQFAVEEIEYLGFKISQSRRSPTTFKVDKIRNFPAPTTKKELDSFIGLAGQYRNLIEDFSAKAECLYDLKKKSNKKAKLKWSPEHQAAFEALKEELTKPPVVMLPDCSKPFIVRTDASGTGMGAVLCQVIDGQRRVIEYASKQFKGAQLRYPTIEKEATAIDYALKRWRHLLLGGEFTLETDHRPLQFLDSMKETHGKLARMALRVQQFKPFTIVHIPGKDNVEADLLSRMVATIKLDYSEQDDIFYRKQNKPSEFVEDNLGRFRFVGDGKDRLAIPRKHRKEVMHALHDEFGHFAVDRVLNLARNRFFWPGMADDIKKYIAACHNCATMKDSIIPKARMKPTVVEVLEPFSRWHVDVVGPITTPSTSGNKFILVAQDAFSKWPEAMAVSNCNTEVITEWIRSAIINRFGLPDEIMTDHGSQFDSVEFKRFAEETGFKQLNATSYHHQTNGIVERFNRTLEGEVRTTAEQSNQWDEVVDRCLLSYRTTIHKSTRKSPFEVVFGKQPRIPIDGQLSLEAPESTHDHEAIRTQVMDAIEKEAGRSKELYDRTKKTTMRDLHGKKVYWKNMTSNPKEGKHLAPRFKGPFAAERTESPWNYVIKDRDGNTKTVHLDLLKECQNDEPLASGLRGRGRPRKVHKVVYYNSTRRPEGEV